MSNETDAKGLRELAGFVQMSDAQREALERIANRLESDARRDAQYDALQDIGKGAYASIAKMVAALECDESREDAEQRIHEDPLSVEVRSDWYTPGEANPDMANEFLILLGTGGPATRIIGELNEYGEPTRARLQAQDWGTPWTDYRGGDSDTLLAYCRCFYFGEG